MNNINNGYCGRVLIKKHNNYIYTHICNITNIAKYEILEEKNNVTVYRVLDDLKIHTINKSQKIELDKITKFIVKSGFTELNQASYANDYFYANGLISYDKKESKTKYIPYKKYEKNYFVSSYNCIEKLDGYSFNDGLCFAYYLIYFDRLEKENIFFYGSQNPLVAATLTATYDDIVTTVSGDKLLIKSDKYHKIINENNFYYNINIIRESDDFLHGIIVGLIANNGEIVKDDKGMYFIKINNLEKKQILHLSYVLRMRFNIFSKTIFKDEDYYLSIKINERLYNMLQRGKDENILSLPDDFTFVKQKEIFIKEFKIIPWYKLEFAMDTNESKLYTFELENNNVFMLSNGLFTLN